jgi:oligopeptide transport system ATP-binding protein
MRGRRTDGAVTPLVDVRGLIKDFPLREGLFGGQGHTRAVDDVSFSIGRGETLSLVGESGSGKTTTARCILRLIEPTAGTILFRDKDLRALSPSALRRERRHMQIVFQDPYSSLNPRMRVGRIVEEPLEIHRVGTSGERAARVRDLFGLVGLDPDHLGRYPSEFSGGQRQRIAIARAIALEPSFVVADEPVSALDMSVQAQVVDLLVDLQQRLNIAYLFIAHDLRLVRRISSRVGVMYRGRIVEVAPPEVLFTSPAHSYTRALLSAMPRLRPGERIERIRFDHDVYEPRPLRQLAEHHLAAI